VHTVAAWLIKSEPGKYSWEMLVRDRRTFWDGVRNYQARNNLQAMKKGDTCFFYHSNVGKEIVGVARVVRGAYQDPTTDDDRWVVVDVAPGKAMKTPVTLAALKADARTAKMALIKQSRLSVSPVTAAEYKAVLALGGVKPGS
jgi:predicted RNA-binding protein with PUA-like domain